MRNDETVNVRYMVEDVDLQLWQEALGTVTKDVSVADGVTTVTVEMSRK